MQPKSPQRCLYRPADAGPSERATYRPGFIIGPAIGAIVAVWAGALLNHQGQHRLAAAVLLTIVILVIVGGGVYSGQRGFKKPRSKRHS